MASRITNKPNPAVKQNVRRARAAAAKGGQRAHASVVAASIAATIFAWALFSHQDAQALEEAARLANANQAAITIAAPTQVPAGEIATR
jgi:hypothetical protein